MTSVVIPGLDLVPSLPSRVVTVDLVDMTEGEQVAGAKIDFFLPADLHVPADDKILQAGRVTLTLDASGHGEIRLPAYTDTVRPADWVIGVKKHWAPHPYYIRVPQGSTKISLADIPTVEQIPDSVINWMITGASATITEGAQWAADLSLTGGILQLSLTAPPGGEAWSKGTLTAATDRDTLTPGVYRVQSGTVATAIGLPVARVGTLEVLQITQVSQVKVHRFTTNDVNPNLPLEVWVQATNQNGTWVRDWQQIYPVDLSPAQHYRGTLHAHLPGDPTTLDTGIYDLRSGSAATAWLLPVARAGVLEVVHPETGAGRFMRFTTNDTINLGLETWVRAPNQNSEWTRDWVRTYPPEEGGMTPSEVSGLIASELVPYATKAELAAAIAALPDPVTAFGVDPDGVPYLMIGE